MVLYWNFRSHRSFAINFSFSDIVAPNSYGCGDARLDIKMHLFGHSSLCPNVGPTNMLDVDIEVKLILNYHRGNAVRNKQNDSYLTKISSQYQIVDFRNVSIKGLSPTRL